MITPNKIIRSNRRTVSIIINKRAEVIVRAPINCDDRRIFDFVSKKQDWINAKINEIKAHIKTLDLIDDATIDIIGVTYIIRLTDKSRVKIDSPYIIIPKVNSRDRLVSFLKKLAHDYLSTRVDEIAKLYKFEYKSIKITSAKSRWGSCSGDNSLNFTYRLMLAPKSIIDYIIIHELTHTKIKNHSRRFYSAIARIMPDYRVAERWLRDNRAIIELI